MSGWRARLILSLGAMVLLGYAALIALPFFVAADLPEAHWFALKAAGVMAIVAWLLYRLVASASDRPG